MVTSGRLDQGADVERPDRQAADRLADQGHQGSVSTWHHPGSSPLNRRPRGGVMISLPKPLLMGAGGGGSVLAAPTPHEPTHLSSAGGLLPVR